ncbi:MAG: RluA family pseudouridine synthase [Kiritimatiellae bacterium]|nr:RluA family pseudouridine synthase [Kiritimatiellia bacterium]
MKRRSGKRLPFKILYEDKNVIVIDKPAGLLSTHTLYGTRREQQSQITAENILSDYLRKGQQKSRLRAWLVHRLDKDTSGVMIFAKSEEVANYFRSDWANLTEKTYHATVDGVIEEDEGVFETYMLEDADGYRVRSVLNGGKKAITRWKVLSRLKNATNVEVKLETGRKNQIRVHFSEAGHPVSGDVKYGSKKRVPLALRSVELSFILPDGRKIKIVAPE